MYLPAFPALARSLDAAPGAVQATLSAYLVGLAVGQAVYGPLADRLGRRPPLLAGLLLYTVAAVGCAVAPRIDLLIGLRFVQALGGSACLVIPRAVVRDCFEAQTSARVYSQLMLVIGAAPILAPLVGGQIAALVGWRGIFGLLAALGAAGLVATLAALPETRPASPPPRRGAGLVNYGRLLADGRFVGFALCAGLAMAGMFAYIAESPFVLIELYGIPAEAYGWVFGSNAAALIAASQVNVLLVGRWHPQHVLARSVVVSALLGLALVAATAAPGLPLPLLLALLFLSMGSRGFIQPNAVACAMAHHPERAGSASALFGVVQFGGATLASVVVGALHDGTARPMAAVMAGSGVLGLAAYLALARGRR